MKTREKKIILIITIILGLISYFYFLGGYYSVDTEWIYTRGFFDYATKDAYVRDGRLFSAIVFTLLSFTNLSIKNVYIINIFISIFISSISVLQIYKIINKYKTIEKKYLKIFAFMISYLYIYNFTQMNIMLFIDSAIINASILFFIISIEKTIMQEKRKLGFLYALIATFCYQGTIPVYIATAFLICLIKYKKVNKQFLKELLVLAITIISVSLINLLTIILIPYITNLELTERLALTEVITGIINNIHNFYNIIFDCQNYFPKYLWIIICSAIIIITSIYGIKNKRWSIPINILFVFAIYFISSLIMLPMVPINNQTEIGRAFMTIGEAIAGLMIYMICNTDIFEKKSIYKNIVTSILILYFSFNIFNTIKVTNEHKIANKIDENIAKKVEKEVKQIEGENVKSFKYTIYYLIDEKTNERNKYNQIIFRNSLLLKCMYTEKMMEFYIGNGIKPQKLMYDEEIVEENFETKSNKDFQIKKINDVFYIVVHV